MNSLPPEIKLKIFNRLSIRDSIKCRQVCKDWLAIIDCLRYKSLDFCVSFNERSEERYFEKDNDLWILNFEKFFRSVTMDPIFNRIKVMNGIGYLSGNLGVFINNFHELEVLNLFSVQNLENFILNLKFLKKLYFSDPPNEVKLETPSLTHLATSNLLNFKICFPDQIKCLEVKSTLKLTKFTNLEILIIDDYFNEENTLCQLLADFLHQLPQLKRVYIGYEWGNFEKRLDQIPVDRNTDLQVYYKGFRINSDLFGNFDWTNIKNIKNSYDGEWTSFMARNYSTSIDDNPHKLYLDYTRLLEEFDQNVPNDFFKKISKIDSIGNFDDEIKIFKFLDSTKPRITRHMYIENLTLSRSFFEQLSKFSFVEEFVIRTDEWPTFLDDFNFDFKNKETSFYFDIRCSLKSLKPALEILKRARSIRLSLYISCDEFSLCLMNFGTTNCCFFGIRCFLNGELIRDIERLEESLDFYFNLDRQVPSIVDFKDKLRLFSIIEEYDAQKTIMEKVKRKLYQNPIYSIKF